MHEPPTLGKMDTIHSGDEDEDDNQQSNLIPVPQEVTFDFNSHQSRSQGSTPFESKPDIPD